jgi:signal transduction histidine kinase
LISADHSRVDFRVIDEGPGVPDEFKQAIFKPFNRGVGSSSAVAGTGVGLAVVKLITERMHGSVFVVDNDAGKGSCFVLRFPVSASNSVANDPAITSQ